MKVVHPTRPRPWWVHTLFLALLGALVLLALTAPGDADGAAIDDAAEVVGFVGVVLVAFAVSVLVDPYAGPLLLAATAVVGTATGSDAFDDNTFAFVVPVTVCAGFYYAVHVWVSARVWELSDGGRTSVADDVRERRALVLEIGRRFLVAWTLLFLLEMLSAVVSTFGDHSQAVLTAVRDAGGVVVVIDVLALAPLRLGEARRIFDEYRLRRTLFHATTVSPDCSPSTLVWRQPPVAVSAAGLRSARVRARRHPAVPESALSRSTAGAVTADRHAQGEQGWTTSAPV